MTRAEQRALEAYPRDDDKELNFRRANYRIAYERGYEQAEKDIKELIEEQLAILDKQTLLHPDDDVFWGQRNAYKQMKDKLNVIDAAHRE